LYERRVALPEVASYRPSDSPVRAMSRGERTPHATRAWRGGSHEAGPREGAMNVRRVSRLVVLTMVLAAGAIAATPAGANPPPGPSPIIIQGPPPLPFTFKMV